jgi:hypothetical protein
MERERENLWVEFDWDKLFFYAPESAKDQIESRMKQLFITLQKRKIKTEELYYEIPSQIESNIKTLSGNYQCYPIIKRKTKLKSFPMMKQQSLDITDRLPLTVNPLSLSPMAVCEATFPNGLIKALIGDIAQQQVRQL